MKIDVVGIRLVKEREGAVTTKKSHNAKEMY